MYHQCLQKFWLFFFRFLSRRQAPQVTKLRVSCHYCDIRQFDLLLDLFAKQNVKELQFEAIFTVLNDPFFLPRSSLAPRSYYNSAFGNLKSLRLVTVYFHDAKITEELFTNCGFLENLSLEYCLMQRLDVLNISAPNIKKFTFFNMRCNEFYRNLFRGRLNMQTPNIVNFCYNGPLICWEFSHTSSLNHAGIALYYEKCFVLNEPKFAAMVSSLNCAKALSLPSVVPLERDCVLGFLLDGNEHIAALMKGSSGRAEKQ